MSNLCGAGNFAGDHILPNPKPNLARVIQASWAAFAMNGNLNIYES
ncbi:MAG: hypothetical protein IKN12_07060 [Selenomonadaceae bacterium]|nr:hypothetical protein [Selenomonadaceae bacterium]MBR3722511.1 hypothetical protein [Selenomonadaceae bacterium]